MHFTIIVHSIIGGGFQALSGLCYIEPYQRPGCCLVTLRTTSIYR